MRDLCTCWFFSYDFVFWIKTNLFHFFAIALSTFLRIRTYERCAFKDLRSYLNSFSCCFLYSLGENPCMIFKLYGKIRRTSIAKLKPISPIGSVFYPKDVSFDTFPMDISIWCNPILLKASVKVAGLAQAFLCKFCWCQSGWYSSIWYKRLLIKVVDQPLIISQLLISVWYILVCKQHKTSSSIF
jgi:hypothetical protein